MTLITFATSGVDYDLLAQQKLTLLNMLGTPGDNCLGEQQIQDLDGIINFIDAFQDAIVESHIKTEEEVFSI
jgi:hypothetical protein